MFSKEDYRNYIQELQNFYRENLLVYTDLLNELDDKALRSSLLPIAEEDMEAFDFLEALREEHF